MEAQFTSSPRLNAALQQLLQLLLRQFVDGWYRLISDNQDFRNAIASVSAFATRELERRCTKVDWIQLVVKDIPRILVQHCRDFRACRERVGTSYAGGLSLYELFANMQPHFALHSPETEHEYLRQISETMLHYLIPPSEYQSEIVRLLIRENMTNIVMKELVNKLSDPDFLNDIIILLICNDRIDDADMESELAKIGIRLESDDDKNAFSEIPLNDAPALSSSPSSSSSSSSKGSTIIQNAAEAKDKEPLNKAVTTEDASLKASQIDATANMTFSSSSSSSKYGASPNAPFEPSNNNVNLPSNKSSSPFSVSFPIGSSPNSSPYPASESIESQQRKQHPAPEKNSPSSSPNADIPAGQAPKTEVPSSKSGASSTMQQQQPVYDPNQHPFHGHRYRDHHRTLSAGSISIARGSSSFSQSHQLSAYEPQMPSTVESRSSPPLSSPNATLPSTPVEIAVHPDSTSSLTDVSSTLTHPISSASNLPPSRNATSDTTANATTNAATNPRMRTLEPNQQESSLPISSTVSNQRSPGHSRSSSVDDLALRVVATGSSTPPLSMYHSIHSSFSSTHTLNSPSSASVSSSSPSNAAAAPATSTANAASSSSSSSSSSSQYTSGMRRRSSLPRVIVRTELVSPTSSWLLNADEPGSANLRMQSKLQESLKEASETNMGGTTLMHQVQQLEKKSANKSTNNKALYLSSLNGNDQRGSNSNGSQTATGANSQREQQPQSGIVAANAFTTVMSTVAHARRPFYISRSVPFSEHLNFYGGLFLDMVRETYVGPWQLDTIDIHTYDGEYLDEHLYDAVDEIFGFSRNNAWLYAQLHFFGKPFVHLIGSAVVNRIIIRFVHWLICEDSLIRYIHLTRDTFWTNEVWNESYPPRTAREQKLNRMYAEHLLKSCMPDVLHSLLGKEDLDRSLSDVVESVQHMPINRHLVFLLVDLIVAHIFPEMCEESSLVHLPLSTV